jgi:glycosyltransferase involved in cell wall biosynthesis
MPTYMTAHLIAGALDSALQQTFREVEIVVVNDGSPDTDELERVLAPYREKIVYIKQENKRAAGARNTAIGQAKGEFLAFLDSDDTWFPDHLASQMKLFEQDPALDLVYSDGWVDTPDWSRRFMEMCPSRGPATFEALVVERCQIPVSTVVAHRRALEKANFFDESLARCDDYDMWLRAAFWGAKVGYSREVQARFSGNRPGALGTSSIKMTEAYWQILEKTLQALPLDEKQRHLVQQRAAEARARYLLERGKVELGEGRLREARELLSESNMHFQKTKLTLVLLGLKIAPDATKRVVSFAKKIRHAVP